MVHICNYYSFKTDQLHIKKFIFRSTNISVQIICDINRASASLYVLSCFITYIFFHIFTFNFSVTFYFNIYLFQITYNWLLIFCPLLYFGFWFLFFLGDVFSPFTLVIISVFWSNFSVCFLYDSSDLYLLCFPSWLILYKLFSFATPMYLYIALIIVPLCVFCIYLFMCFSSYSKIIIMSIFT